MMICLERSKRNNPADLYGNQTIYNTAFFVVTANYDTQTATDPRSVPAVELGGTEDPLEVRSARNIAALLLGNSAPTDRDPLTIDLAVRYTAQIVGVPTEQVDVAVARELIAQASQ